MAPGRGKSEGRKERKKEGRKGGREEGRRKEETEGRRERGKKEGKEVLVMGVHPGLVSRTASLCPPALGCCVLACPGLPAPHLGVRDF
jgi:hypothetical protein